MRTPELPSPEVSLLGLCLPCRSPQKMQVFSNLLSIFAIMPSIYAKSLYLLFWAMDFEIWELCFQIIGVRRLCAERPPEPGVWSTFAMSQGGSRAASLKVHKLSQGARELPPPRFEKTPSLICFVSLSVVLNLIKSVLDHCCLMNVTSYVSLV